MTMVHASGLRIRVFQHVPFEDIGSMEAWARERGHAVAYTRFHAGDSAPAVSAYDFLIVMGGPMGAYEGDSRARDAGITLYTRLINLLGGTDVSDIANGYRAIRASRRRNRA